MIFRVWDKEEKRWFDEDAQKEFVEDYLRDDNPNVLLTLRQNGEPVLFAYNSSILFDASVIELEGGRFIVKWNKKKIK